MCSRITGVICECYIVLFRGLEYLWIWIFSKGRGIIGSHFLRIANDNSFLKTSWALLKMTTCLDEAGGVPNWSWVGM